MNTNTTHSLTQLLTAEAQLVASIDAAADRLDAVGTDTLNAALARFQAAALAATDRLARAGRAVELMAGEVVADLAALRANLTAALAPIAGSTVQTPAPSAGIAFNPESPEELADLERGDYWDDAANCMRNDLDGIAGIASGETIDLAAQVPTAGTSPNVQQAQEGTPTAAPAAESSSPTGVPSPVTTDERSVDEKVAEVKAFLDEQSSRRKGRKPAKRTTHASNGTH